jgi:hypothetical protein
MNPLILTKILGWFARVPWFAWVILALLAWGGWQRHQAISARDSLTSYKAEVQAAFDKQRAEDAAETARRAKVMQEVADSATIQANANRADADSARAALERLRTQFARGNAGAGNPSAAPGGPPAGAAGSVPPELLLRCAERVVELAGYADASRTAGQACERAYDSLTRRGPNP